jgi:hypothetical protein
LGLANPALPRHPDRSRRLGRGTTKAARSASAIRYADERLSLSFRRRPNRRFPGTWHDELVLHSRSSVRRLLRRAWKIAKKRPVLGLTFLLGGTILAVVYWLVSALLQDAAVAALKDAGRSWVENHPGSRDVLNDIISQCIAHSGWTTVAVVVIGPVLYSAGLLTWAEVQERRAVRRPPPPPDYDPAPASSSKQLNSEVGAVEAVFAEQLSAVNRSVQEEVRRLASSGQFQQISHGSVLLQSPGAIARHAKRLADSASDSPGASARHPLHRLARSYVDGCDFLDQLWEVKGSWDIGSPARVYRQQVTNWYDQLLEQARIVSEPLASAIESAPPLTRNGLENPRMVVVALPINQPQIYLDEALR